MGIIFLKVEMVAGLEIEIQNRLAKHILKKLDSIALFLTQKSENKLDLLTYYAMDLRIL